MKNQEQKLVDIMFQVGIMIHTHEWFKNKTVPEVAEYIATQLRECGFDTEPVGASWGSLK